MLLSEAIRQGAMPQSFGTMHDTKAQRTEAVGLTIEQYGRKLKELYPWLFASADAQCPDCGRKGQNPVQIIIHLNDYHCWRTLKSKLARARRLRHL